VICYFGPFGIAQWVKEGLLWTSGEDAGIVEQRVEGELDVEVALHYGLFD